MTKLLYFIKYYIKNPIEFYSKLNGIIISYFLKFKCYDISDSMKNMKNNGKRINKELIKNWNCYSYLCERYANYIDSLPIYKGSSSRANNVWRCWLQGEKNAPKINQSCLLSVRHFINKQKIVIITNQNLEDYVNLPEYIIKKHKKGIIPHAHFSDLIRLELLIKYGGTWIDSSVLMTGYEKTFFDSDFFVFNNLDSGDESIVASNRFITSNKNNPILLTTRDLLFKYRKDNNYLINYFIFHMFFTMTTKKYPEIRDNMPKYSNVPPHTMQHEFLNGYSKEKLEELKIISSVHKLRNVRNANKNSLFEYIKNMYF